MIPLPGRIQQLSSMLANQIAAGEVIERPASVVKELLENALDAHADTIHIEIGFGGLNQIKISDNGTGIVAEDLPLAIMAHATSKISELSDLHAIQSMGFRGEALASIAAVSRLIIRSKPNEQAHAVMLQAENGKYTLIPCARNMGTTIEVQDLFFNAPVRKRFLRSEQSEYLAIEAIVKRFALSKPALAITLKHNDKLMLTLPATTCVKTKLLRIRKLLGNTFIDQAIYLDKTYANMRIEGFISGSTYQRSQNDKQWIYLNQRMVKDKLILHAIKQAYADLLHPGRHFACVLYITMPAETVDVNVHPTKHEVRFQEPRLVHDFIHAQIAQAFCATQTTFAASANPAPPLMLQETYIPPQMPQKTIAQSCTWFILNARFAIIVQKANAEPYLIDIQRLYQDWFSSLLQSEEPLASRQLLWPVHISINKVNIAWLETYQSFFSRVGVVCDCMGDEHLVVRAIPQCLPYLDIKQFILAIFTEKQLTYAAFTECLIANQMFDIQQLPEEEKLNLSRYWQQQWLGKNIKHYKHLDIAHCCEYLYG